jgi:hypothetical protein
VVLFLEADKSVIATASRTVDRVEHSGVFQLPSRPGKPASSTDDIDNVAVIRDRGDAGKRTN